ncbi:MAG: serine/threonine-protein kinase [Bacteroidota bacterium]
MASSADLWPAVSAALDAILDLQGEARGDALAALDPPVRAEVEALLALDGEADRVLGGSATDFADPLLRDLTDEIDQADADDEVGRRVGPYEVVGVLGRGGMGTVYRARRVDGTFDQTVALKLLRRGLDTDDLVARFRSERQILAALDHPSIARLYDGGKSNDGRPYFAMELVEGEPVTAWADRQRLGTGARLRLFATICDAVHHAHQRLVVHRDLKPSNVLVGGTPAAPVVKLLDFGIAKVLGSDGTDTPLTRTGHQLLTPEYAAPEQIEGDAITTATDVYGLGALLYELVAGERPFAEAGRRAIEEAVLSREPARPSTRASDHAPTHGTTADRLRKELAGDVDVICLKALRKEPERRYASAEALGDDIRRHLDGRPVDAQPDTLRYRARTFVRRNRGAVAAAAAIAALLAGLAGTASWAAVTTARQAEAVAEERDRAEGLADYLVGLLGEADPFQTSQQSVSVDGLIDRGIATIDEAFADDPLARARTLTAFGSIETRLGRFDRADSLLTLAESVLADVPGADVPVAVALGERGAYFAAAGDPVAADSVYRLALARATAGGQADPSVEGSLASGLGTALVYQGRYSAADSVFAQSLTLAQATGDTRATMTAYVNLAETAAYLSDTTRALRRTDDAVSLLDQAEIPPAVRGRTLFTLGTAMTLLERFDRAIALFQEAIEVQSGVLGPMHPDIATMRNNLGFALQNQPSPDLDGALAEFRTAYTIYASAPGDATRGLSPAEGNIGSVHADAGRLDSAAAAYRRAVRLAGDDPLDDAVGRHNLAGILRVQGRLPEAERQATRAVEVIRATVGNDHPYTAIIGMTLASVRAARDPAGALDEVREAVEATDAAFGEGHWRGAIARTHLSRTLLQTGDGAGARRLIGEIAPAVRQQWAPTNVYRVEFEQTVRSAR